MQICASKRFQNLTSQKDLKNAFSKKLVSKDTYKKKVHKVLCQVFLPQESSTK